MKEYLTFRAEDFVNDDAFFKWVKYPERYPDLDRFWRQWLADNPHKKEAIEEARLMILAIAREKKYKPAGNKQLEVWRRIDKTILEPAPRTVPLWRPWLGRAAAVLILLGAGLYAWQGYAPEAPAPPAERVAGAEPYLEKHVNNSDLPKTLILSDETSIVLQPNSALEYPAAFEDDRREVYLTGEAFFEVTKDPARPFLVHANEIVTRVLGTSFTVRNYNNEKNVLVQVKTGKVSVFKEKQRDVWTAAPEKTVEGVVLLPNQQVVYEREEMKMTRSLVEDPHVLAPVARQEFEFSDAPIKDVFAAIEQAYGVDIVYDEEALSDCHLNASLVDVPLFGKLNLICRAIHTTYEVIDSHIVIYGKGCGSH